MSFWGECTSLFHYWSRKEFKSEDNEEMTLIRLRAHRDELISLENELRDRLKLKSDGSLFKTPI